MARRKEERRRWEKDGGGEACADKPWLAGRRLSLLSARTTALRCATLTREMRMPQHEDPIARARTRPRTNTCGFFSPKSLFLLLMHTSPCAAPCASDCPTWGSSLAAAASVLLLMHAFKHVASPLILPSGSPRRPACPQSHVAAFVDEERVQTPSESRRFARLHDVYHDFLARPDAGTRHLTRPIVGFYQPAAD